MFLLGTLPVQYVLHSENFISDRTMTKFDWITNSMAENGLYEFYGSAAQFNLSLKRFLSLMFSHNNDDDIPPLTMQQFKRVMIINLCFNALATIAFVAETLIFKLMMWRNRKYPFRLVLIFGWEYSFYLVTLSLFINIGKIQIPLASKIDVQPKSNLKQANFPLKRSHTARSNKRNPRRTKSSAKDAENIAVHSFNQNKME